LVPKRTRSDTGPLSTRVCATIQSLDVRRFT
jgi:hypothetical protein